MALLRPEYKNKAIFGQGAWHTCTYAWPPPSGGHLDHWTLNAKIRRTLQAECANELLIIGSADLRVDGMLTYVLSLYHDIACIATSSSIETSVHTQVASVVYTDVWLNTFPKEQRQRKKKGRSLAKVSDFLVGHSTFHSPLHMSYILAALPLQVPTQRLKCYTCQVEGELKLCNHI